MKFSFTNSVALWTYKEVARYLSLSESHVRRLVSQNRIPSMKIGGSRRFDPEQVRQWVRSQAPS